MAESTRKDCLGMAITQKNMALVMSLGAAILFPVAVKFAGGNTWAYALTFAPTGAVSVYLGCRLGQWYFGSSRRG